MDNCKYVELETHVDRVPRTQTCVFHNLFFETRLTARNSTLSTMVSILRLLRTIFGFQWVEWWKNDWIGISFVMGISYELHLCTIVTPSMLSSTLLLLICISFDHTSIFHVHFTSRTQREQTSEPSFENKHITLAKWQV